MDRRVRTALIGWLLAGAAITPAIAQDEPAFAGAAEIRLGDDVQSVIAGLPGEVHSYTFFATKSSRLSAVLDVDDGNSLLAGLRLVEMGGTVLREGRVTNSSNVGRLRLDEYTFVTSGYFALEVVRESGTGGYELDTKARRDKRIRGIDPTPGSAGTWRFDAPGNSVVDIRVRIPKRHRRGRGGPVITNLIAPDGSELPIFPSSKTASAKVLDVLLPQSGTYTLHWENPANGRRLRFKFDLSALGGARRDRLFPTPKATAPTAPDINGSTLEARAGYVGSAACGRCHDALYRDWTETAHNLSSREWQQGGLTGIGLVNDVNGNGRDDFQDGVDLGQFPAFEAFGDDAPVLSWEPDSARPARVTIGAVTYDVERSMGGNGLDQQAYVARIGDALYPLPFQYDEHADTYTQFESDFWYAEGAARYGDAAEVGAEVSYEARCSGCHATGVVVETASSGEIVAGWVESQVGCEQCHGPGAEHAASGNPAFIQNPADLLDGSAAGVAAANATCARCHDRGHGVGPIAGSGVVPAYPYDPAQGVAEYGDDLGTFFDVTTDPDDFFGYKPSLVSGVEGDGFVTGRRRYMQQRETNQGHHAPNVGFMPTCFECHSPHSRKREHMLAPVIDRGARIDTRLEDNTYCLACHATFGPFENVSKSDVQQISNGTVPQSVKDATTLHMADNGMAVATLLYDPEGSHVGRCDTCHMPRTAGDGVAGEDAAGWAVGDHASHDFTNVWPRASELYGMTNSCNVCHPTREDDPVQAIIEEWANPDLDGGGEPDTTFHADTPSSFQNGLKNPGNNQGGLPCVQCHTSEGFIRIQVRGEETDQDDWNEMLGSAIAHDEGISCRACHGQDGDGNLGNGRQPLRFPKIQLCGMCHNDETIKFGDFRDRGERVRHPQREMLLGTAGSEVPDSGGYTDSAHSLVSLFPDGCVDCHFDNFAAGEPTHGFQPRVETCAKCHDGLDTFDRPANGDYDGNGVIEGIQTEVTGLLDVVEDGLLMDPEVSFDNGTFNYGDSTDGSMEGASDAQKRAAFNYYSVDGDASRGVHNAIRTVQLLQRSYEEITGNPVPGADLR